VSFHSAFGAIWSAAKLFESGSNGELFSASPPTFRSGDPDAEAVEDSVETTLFTAKASAKSSCRGQRQVPEGGSLLC
jgi:hypothetical protein